MRIESHTRKWGMFIAALGLCIGTPAQAESITDVSGRAFHVDATQIEVQTHNTDLTTWYDLSGSDLDASETTPAEKPHYLLNGQNGRPVVNFFSGQWLGTAATDVLTSDTSDDFTVFAVYKHDNVSSDRTVVAQFDFANSDREWIYFTNSGNSLFRTSSTGNTNTDTENFGSAPVGSFQVDAITKAGSSTTLVRDGSSVAGAGTTATNVYGDATPILLGGVGDHAVGSPVSGLDGRIAEVVIYDRALSAGERQQVETYLHNKWVAAPKAGLAVQESFEYATAGVGADGDQAENGGFGFAGAWTNVSNTMSFNTDASLAPVPGSGNVANGGMIADGSDDSRARRTLATGIDFDADDTHYLSVLMRKSDSNSTDGGEFHQLLLVNGASEKFVIGTDSAERLTLNDVAAGGTGDTMLLDETYMLVAKIVTNDSGNDEYFLKAFGSGGTDTFDDMVTLNEPVSWDLTFSGAVTGLADAIELRTGPNAIGMYDDIRLGSSWASVTGVPTPAALPAGLALMGMLTMRRRR